MQGFPIPSTKQERIWGTARTDARMQDIEIAPTKKEHMQKCP